jgi:hypothetical protein
MREVCGRWAAAIVGIGLVLGAAAPSYAGTTAPRAAEVPGPITVRVADNMRYVLDTETNQSGFPVAVARSNNSSEQQWYFDQSDGSYGQLISAASQLCATYLGDPTQRAPLFTTSCRPGNVKQLWAIMRQGDGYRVITPGLKCLIGATMSHAFVNTCPSRPSRADIWVIGWVPTAHSTRLHARPRPDALSSRSGRR